MAMAAIVSSSQTIFASGRTAISYMTDFGMAAADFIDGQNFVRRLHGSRLGRPRLRDRSHKMKVLRVIDRGIRFTNGIAFGPDRQLYANASFTGEIIATTSSVKGPRSAISSATSCSPTMARLQGPGRNGVWRRWPTLLYGLQPAKCHCSRSRWAVQERLLSWVRTDQLCLLPGRPMALGDPGGRWPGRALPAPCGGLPLYYPRTQ